MLDVKNTSWFKGTSIPSTRKSDLPTKGSGCPPGEDTTYQCLWSNSIYNPVKISLQVGLRTPLYKTHLWLSKVAFPDADLPNSSFQILKRRRTELKWPTSATARRYPSQPLTCWTGSITRDKKARCSGSANTWFWHRTVCMHGHVSKEEGEKLKGFWHMMAFLRQNCVNSTTAQQ